MEKIQRKTKIEKSIRFASYIIPDTSNENQTYIFENLPKYNELGNEIVYTIDEEEVNEGDLEFYTKQISGTTIKENFPPHLIKTSQVPQKILLPRSNYHTACAKPALSLQFRTKVSSTF